MEAAEVALLRRGDVVTVLATVEHVHRDKVSARVAFTPCYLEPGDVTGVVRRKFETNELVVDQDGFEGRVIALDGDEVWLRSVDGERRKAAKATDLRLVVEQLVLLEPAEDPEAVPPAPPSEAPPLVDPI